MLHVVGRTRTDPAIYYYRTFDLYLPRYLGGRKRVLELGCGTGDSIPRFSPHVDELWAFDFSREMLRAAQRKLEGADFAGRQPPRGRCQGTPVEFQIGETSEGPKAEQVALVPEVIPRRARRRSAGHR